MERWAEFHIKRGPVSRRGPPLMSHRSGRGGIADYRSIIQTLLLTRDELLDQTWVPSITLADFLRYRVRPCVYFLQTCLLKEGSPEEADVRVLFATEYEELQFHMLTLLGTVVCIFA